jgi:predicted nuclease of restriction endonuclease-like (RecB) superfamily
LKLMIGGDHMAEKRQSRSVRPVVRPSVADLPVGYGAFLEDLKSRIRAAQVKAALSVNRELIQLYWSIGRDIVARQHAEGWGAAVIDRLAADIQRDFPGLGGFSRANIYRMRAFYLAYSRAPAIVSQAARQTRRGIVSQGARQSGMSTLPESMLSLPWFHNVVLLESLKSPAERLWYAREAMEHGWSRAMLVHWIESDLYARQGKAVTNFPATLPPAQSDLAGLEPENACTPCKRPDYRVCLDWAVGANDHSPFDSIPPRWRAR